MAELLGIAGGGEAAERRRVALVVGRPVVAEHVQHDDAVAAVGPDPRLQAGQQDLVEAALAVAQRRIRGIGHRLERKPVADTLAAGLVVAPQHLHARALEHVQQRLVAADLLRRSEEHTSELQSLMRISYAVFWLKKKKRTN